MNVCMHECVHLSMCVRLRVKADIFFASVIPALTFGEQLSDETEGQINGVHVLITMAMCGTIQALFGGQPLLIVGVALPIGPPPFYPLSRSFSLSRAYMHIHTNTHKHKRTHAHARAHTHSLCLSLRLTD